MFWFIIALFIGFAQANEHEWLRSWIPQSCCVTNQCCFQIRAHDVTPLSRDEWRVELTGEIAKRTGWSPDGGYYRCACVNVAGNWIQSPTAHTRCLFVPRQMM